MTTFERFSRVLSIAALIAALGLIIGSPHYFVGHPHWRRIVWVPYSESRLSPEDVIVNLLVFFPFGFLWAFGNRRGAQALARVGLLVTALSVACEFYQIFCHERFPSATDVVDNSLGVFAGLWSGSAFSKPSAKLFRPGQ